MTRVHRLWWALAAFAGLGILAWTTLTEPRIRAVCLAILALFAVKTWLRRNEREHDRDNVAGSGGDEPD